MPSREHNIVANLVLTTRKNIAVSAKENTVNRVGRELGRDLSLKRDPKNILNRLDIDARGRDVIPVVFDGRVETDELFKVRDIVHDFFRETGTGINFDKVIYEAITTVSARDNNKVSRAIVDSGGFRFIYVLNTSLDSSETSRLENMEKRDITKSLPIKKVIDTQNIDNSFYTMGTRVGSSTSVAVLDTQLRSIKERELVAVLDAGDRFVQDAIGIQPSGNRLEAMNRRIARAKDIGD